MFLHPMKMQWTIITHYGVKQHRLRLNDDIITIVLSAMIPVVQFVKTEQYEYY